MPVAKLEEENVTTIPVLEHSSAAAESVSPVMSLFTVTVNDDVALTHPDVEFLTVRFPV